MIFRPHMRLNMDIFCSVSRSGFINSGWSTFVPLCSPDVKDDLAKSRRLNQSDAASCVTGRCHGYLAATATRVNVSCQRMMDEAGFSKKEKENIQPQVCTQTDTEPHWVSPRQECKWCLDSCHVASGIQLFFQVKREKVPQQLKWRVINKEKKRDHT